MFKIFPLARNFVRYDRTLLVFVSENLVRGERYLNTTSKISLFSIVDKLKGLANTA
jgi:hypothetical protein